MQIRIAAGAILLLLAATWLFLAGNWLAAPSVQPRKSDLIVVLGGDAGDRSIRSLELYKAGIAPNVLITGVPGGPEATRKSYLSWRAQFLVDLGVPKEAILYDESSSNSRDEAQYTSMLMKSRGWKRVVVVSDPPHMRRLDLTWGRVFEGSGLEYDLVATRPEWWRPDGWWMDEKSAQMVITEHIKLVYYWVKWSWPGRLG